jgi:hypothetical protein
VRIALAERIESLKVGGISALASIPFLGVYIAVFGEPLTIGPARLFGGTLSGFLFGVTYRYLVRDDTNPHLKGGAVAAFALVRGLVPLQLSEDPLVGGTRSSIFLGESFVCFLICRAAIERFRPEP